MKLEERRAELQRQIAEAQEQQQAAYQVIDQTTRRIIALMAKLELLDELESEGVPRG